MIIEAEDKMCKKKIYNNPKVRQFLFWDKPDKTISEIKSF